MEIILYPIYCGIKFVWTKFYGFIIFERLMRSTYIFFMESMANMNNKEKKACVIICFGYIFMEIDGRMRISAKSRKNFKPPCIVMLSKKKLLQSCSLLHVI